MRIVFSFLMLSFAAPAVCFGQVGGNVGYSQSGAKAKAEQVERSRRVLVEHDVPPTGVSTFIEADVLMNVKATAFVAVFAIAEEGETVAECSRKMGATIASFSRSVLELGIPTEALFVDFVAQTRTYGYEVEGNVARERLVGFELKKNLSVHYKDRALLDRLITAAADSRVHDLVKVDYIVEDTDAVQERLAEEAARVIKKKAARYERLLGTKLGPRAQVYADRTSAHYPTELYDSYTAAESQEIGVAASLQGMTIQSARKSRTFYYNGLDGDGFDAVINPVVLEPVVQFTLHMRVRYDMVEPGTE